jgi:hypothetical protein
LAERPTPHGRSRAGDRHLNFYETRDNLCFDIRRILLEEVGKILNRVEFRLLSEGFNGVVAEPFGCYLAQDRELRTATSQFKT